MRHKLYTRLSAFGYKVFYFQVDGLTDMNAMKQVIAKLETELHEKSTNVSYLEAEIRTLQRKLQMKDAEIAKQERELHKLRVMQLDNSIPTFLSFLKNSSCFNMRCTICIPLSFFYLLCLPCKAHTHTSVCLQSSSAWQNGPLYNSKCHKIDRLPVILKVIEKWL